VPGGIDTDAIRRSWPDVLAKIFSIKRVTWTFLSEHAQVLDYDGKRLLLGISTVGLANTFRKGQHAELVRQALVEVLGVDAVVEGIPTPDSGAASAASSAQAGGGSSAPARGRPADAAAASDREGLRAMAAASPPPDDLGPEPDDDWSSPSAPPPEWATEPSPSRAASTSGPSGSAQSGSAQSGSAQSGAAGTRPGPGPAPVRADAAPAQAGGAPTTEGAPSRRPQPAEGAERAQPSPRAGSPMERARQAVAREAGTRRTASAAVADDSVVSADDENIEDAGAMGVPVIERVLGGTVMGELDQ
jgi:DNA polymerase-3 subunit gamma/tau